MGGGISYQCYVFRVTLAMLSVVGIGACNEKGQLYIMKVGGLLGKGDVTV